MSSPRSESRQGTRGFRDHGVLALILIASTLLCFWAGPQPNDDAYITYRYADNLAAGHGPIYNLSERVLGTTSPLFTILLAILRCAGLPPVAGSFGLAVVANIVLLFLIFTLLDLEGLRREGLVAAAVVGLLPQWIQYVVMGLETATYVAFVFGAVLAAYVGKAGAAGLLVGFAFLTRPDGVLAAIPVAGLLMKRGWKTVGVAAIAAAIPVIPWYAFATAFFGNPIPHSVVAKSVTMKVGIGESFRTYSERFLEKITWKRPVDLALLAGFVATLALSLRHRAGAAIGGWFFIYSAAFALSGVLVFGWYSAAAIPAYLVLLVLGGSRALERILSGRVIPGPLRLWASVGAGLAVLSVVPRLYAVLRDPAFNATTRAYASCGRFLKAEMRGSPTLLAASEIGAAGYYSEAPVLDLWCLISPESVPYHRRLPRMEAFAAIVKDFRPEWYLTTTKLHPESLNQAAWFVLEYSLALEIKVEGGAVMLYRRTGFRPVAARSSSLKAVSATGPASGAAP